MKTKTNECKTWIKELTINKHIEIHEIWILYHCLVYCFHFENSNNTIFCFLKNIFYMSKFIRGKGTGSSKTFLSNSSSSCSSAALWFPTVGLDLWCWIPCVLRTTAIVDQSFKNYKIQKYWIHLANLKIVKFVTVDWIKLKFLTFARRL